jgi:large subunit ribosomal protein L6
MLTTDVFKAIQIPENINISIEGKKITVKGKKGIVIRDFSKMPVSIELNEKQLRISAYRQRKKELAIAGTVSSHIRNMITGCEKGFTYKLKMVFAHFPMSIKIENRIIIIENFTGERNPRRAKIMGNTQVKIVGEDVIVQGINLENVSQTAANIMQATKVKNKDPRVFLDGVYLYEKSEGMDA